MICFNNILLSNLHKIIAFLKLHNPRIIMLVGELGAGKTTFVQNYLQHLVITSPSFSICNQYILDKQKIYHYDMYRVEVIHHEILTEILTGDLVFIEWAHIIYPYLKNYLTKQDYIIFIHIDYIYIYNSSEINNIQVLEIITKKKLL